MVLCVNVIVNEMGTHVILNGAYTHVILNGAYTHVILNGAKRREESLAHEGLRFFAFGSE